MKREKIYFVSDSHLGVPDYERSLVREKRLVQWLDVASRDAAVIFILGDLFDFWFEYRHVIPKGYSRLLGKLAEITDQGIAVHYFTGNHDMWEFGYFEKELGLKVHRHPIEIVLQGKRCLIGHGDGLGPGDHGYKWLKRIFASRIAQKLFSFLHPGFGIRLASYMSGKSRLAHEANDKSFLGEEREMLVVYSKEVLKTREVDLFVFGHRHYPIMIEIGDGVWFANAGDWIRHFSYLVLEGGQLDLRYYKAGQELL